MSARWRCSLTLDACGAAALRPVRAEPRPDGIETAGAICRNVGHRTLLTECDAELDAKCH